MLIQKTRVRKLDFLNFILKDGQKFIVGISDVDQHKVALEKIGFKISSENESLLPSAVGPVSEFNAEGRYNKLKDLPMETAYRQAEWSWEQWAGYGQTETKTKIVDVPYQRYQREFVEPPSVELSLILTGNGKVLVGPVLINDEASADLNKHVINLFLEIFSEAEFFTENLDQIINIPTKRLNWQILPKGEMPWSSFLDKVKKVVDEAPEGSKPVVVNRLEHIYAYKPDFRAVGTAGFNGYMVFGFEKLGIYVCESIFYGNATYVFENNWEAIAKLTKAQVLSAKLQKNRIIHRDGWDLSLRDELKNAVIADTK